MDKVTIKDMQELAKFRGGKCLSNEYINAHTKLRWQCDAGHVWEAKPNCIKDGTWCPICNINISERICRKYFESIFKKRFPKVRPFWLINSRGYKMELDGYDKHLGIAFEYQGKQHYLPTKQFHNKRSFERQLEDDKRKKEICAEKGIALIQVPYTIKFKDMLNYIAIECMKHGIKIPTTSWIDYKQFNVYSPKKLNEMKQLASKKSGLCLSDKYFNVETKLIWQCKEGHVWEATPHSIKAGHWCPRCAGRDGTIEDMQKLAERHGGKCLSKGYISSKDKLTWQCKEGHVWEATPTLIKHGCWCPKCAGRHQTIEDMQKLAEKHEGKCLSKTYISSKDKLTWQCKEGHTWKAMYSGIRIGQWCPTCAIKKLGATQRLSIEKMQEVAEKRGGRCLSDKYLNSSTKLTWQCKEGHVWQATYGSISMSRWCPICARRIVADKRRLNIGFMQKLAEKHEGKCLSKSYADSRHKLEWQCKKGHIWEAAYNKIYIGRWCPICGGTSKLNMEEMQRIANKKSGTCLSDKYINNKTKLTWQCKEGHVWEATPHVVRSNHWCQKCAAKIRNEKRKLTIDNMQKLAQKRNGECLSRHYINNKSKLKWKCSKGHIWESRPDSIKGKGTWCPTCYKQGRKKKTN